MAWGGSSRVEAEDSGRSALYQLLGISTTGIDEGGVEGQANAH